MIGPANSGKTSIVRRYVDKKFKDDYQVTVGFDYMNKEITIGKKKNKYTIMGYSRDWNVSKFIKCLL